MPNVAHQLQLHFDPAHVAILRRIADAAGRNGARAYLVGGASRDAILGVPHLDLDVMYHGGGPDLPDAIAAGTGGSVTARTEFGTAKLEIEGLLVDLAIARRETYPHPGALPEVFPGTLEEDAARRDFSINAIAVSLSQGTWGDLFDPHHGFEDIKSGTVRALHGRSFADDATRILRAARYAGRLGFRLDGATAAWLARDMHHLGAISGDRVRHELVRIFREPEVSEILAMLEAWGAFRAVLPEWIVDAATLASAGKAAAEPGPQRDARMLALLAYAVAPGRVEALLDRLRPDAEGIKAVRDVHAVKSRYPQLAEPSLKGSDLVFALRGMDPAAVEVCALVAGDALVQGRLLDYLSRLRAIRPSLTGDDLLSLGVPEGPMVGRLLRELHVARLDGHLRSRDEEIAFLRARLPGA
ncbi:MAG: CCA tRNA nucleotidyltransferase [SAR202 cluster bacterium]|nr:CCA tRNA nucleotidyltransferase [SAR202 cluster bacterium]